MFTLQLIGQLLLSSDFKPLGLDLLIFIVTTVLDYVNYYTGKILQANLLTVKFVTLLLFYRFSFFQQ